MKYIDPDRCDGCGACIEVCPEAAIRLVNHTAVIDERLCEDCGVCEDACPQAAIMPLVTVETAPVQAGNRAIEPRRASATPALGVVLGAALIEAAPRLIEIGIDWLDRRSRSVDIQPANRSSPVLRNSPSRDGSRRGRRRMDGRGRGYGKHRQGRQRRRGRY
jgi:NAD-dependent dihydropyrimidine dehydrogenase PreA subunit